MSTKISWTEETWNPVIGCSKVSPGCEHCYAERLSLRFGWTPKPWKAQFAGENVQLKPERLDQPLHWKKPRRIFVNSMSDLFHEQVPDDFIRQVFEVMAKTPQHTYQILTKRPDRMEQLVSHLWDDLYQKDETELAHIWLGTSTQRQLRSGRSRDRARRRRQPPLADYNALYLRGATSSCVQPIEWLTSAHRPRLG